MNSRGRLALGAFVALGLLLHGGAVPRAAEGSGDVVLPASIPVTSIGIPWSARGPSPTIDGQVENIAPAPGLTQDNQVVGAIHAVVAHPMSSDILYVGAVNGGIWKTTNATDPNPTWTPQTDDLDSLSIGALAMDPQDSHHLVAGVGRHSSLAREGGPLGTILQTADGGTSWIEISDPLIDDQDFSGIVVRGNTILASSRELPQPSGNGRTAIRSTDGGATWSQLGGSGLPGARASDIVADPSDPNRYYIALLGLGIYMTADSGTAWNNISASDGTLFNETISPDNNNIELAQ